MIVAAFDPSALRPICVFEADIEALEDLDPEFAVARVQGMTGDRYDIEDMVFYELRDEVSFEKEVHYTVNKR